MTQKQHGDEIEEFIVRFRNNPRLRPAIVNGLIGGTGRLTLNVPGHGLARRIAERLREGPFSDYYEFEKLLARSLHPLMAGLNLNVVADIKVNALFSERYPVYSRELNVALASGKGLDPEAIRKIIVNMAAHEGHYMVIKFYDLVLRGIDAGLCRSLKPVEEAVIRMKRLPGDDEAANLSHVNAVFRKFRDGKGEAAAELLKKRMEWDDVLRAYGAGLEGHGDAAAYEENPSGDAPLKETAADWDDTSENTDEQLREEDAVKPEMRRDSEPAIARYARLIRQDYLDALDPDDEEKVRGIVRGMYLKNQKVYDSEKAAAVVREVLAIWLADDSLDDDVRSVLREIAAEETASSGSENDYSADETAPAGGRQDEIIAADADGGDGGIAEGAFSDGTEMGEDTEADPGPAPVLSGESVVSGNEFDTLRAEEIETIPADELKPIQDEMAVPHDGDVSGEEVEILPDDEAGGSPGAREKAGPVLEDDATADEGVSGGEMEALLADISDEHSDGTEGAVSVSEAGHDEGVSGGEPEALLSEAHGEASDAEAVSSREHGIEPSDEAGVADGELDGLLADISLDMPADEADRAPAPGKEDDFEPVPHEMIHDDQDPFDVKDEILFEDRSLAKRTPVARAKPQRTRISIRDIADTESRRNLLELVELLSKTGSAADVSRFLVGAGVTPAIKYGISDLVGCNDFEEAFDRITGSELFDYNEKIIILEKWLKIIGHERGWFKPPHEGDLEKITKEIESYAAEIRDSAGGEPNEYLRDNGNDGPGTTGGGGAEFKGGPAPVEIQEKEMLKTGDGSLRLSQEIFEFQSLYRAGAGKKTIAKRIPRIQKLFENLAAGEDTAVHFAVYHNQSFVDFLDFIGKNPGLKEMLDIDAAIEYCKRKKII